MIKITSFVATIFVYNIFKAYHFILIILLIALFQTLSSIGNEKNTTIIFPVPIDILSQWTRPKNRKSHNDPKTHPQSSAAVTKEDDSGAQSVTQTTNGGKAGKFKKPLGGLKLHITENILIVLR